MGDGADLANQGIWGNDPVVHQEGLDEWTEYPDGVLPGDSMRTVDQMLHDMDDARLQSEVARARKQRQSERDEREYFGSDSEAEARLEETERWLEGNVDPVSTWTPNAKTFLWRTQDGFYVHLHEMHDSHLLNLERYIQNKGHQRFKVPDGSDARIAVHTIWQWICEELDQRGLGVMLPVHPDAIDRKQGIQRPVVAPTFKPYPDHTKARYRTRRWMRMGLPA